MLSRPEDLSEHEGDSGTESSKEPGTLSLLGGIVGKAVVATTSPEEEEAAGEVVMETMEDMEDDAGLL
jgi:hypothetical protein